MITENFLCTTVIQSLMCNCSMKLIMTMNMAVTD